MKLRLSLVALSVLGVSVYAAAAAGAPRSADPDPTVAVAGTPFGGFAPQRSGQAPPSLVREALATPNGGDKMGRLPDQRRTGAPPASGSGSVGTRTTTPTPPQRGTTPTVVVPKRFTGTRCVTEKGWRVCRTYNQDRLTLTCRSKGKRKTCNWLDRRGRTVRTCIWKPGKKRQCKTIRRPAAFSGYSALRWQGWPSSIASTVGFLAIRYPLGSGGCTATVVDRTMLITAAHCLWNPEAGGYASSLVFVPGMTWDNAAISDSVKMPWGFWNASNWWVPDGYRVNGDMAFDYALVEIPPASTGPISQFTGAWSIQTGIRWGEGAQVYTMGYPSAGFWDTPQGYNGRGQYACDTTWSPPYYQTIGSGYELWTSCTMNRGASGGPWFVKLNDGRWVIGGVNSQCFGADMSPSNYCNPYSSHMRSAYLDGRFLEFWNNVQAQRRY